MRTLLLAVLVLASTVNAQVIECPKFYPTKEVPLAEVPSGHKGNGLIRGARLSRAYISIGKLHSDPNGFEAMQAVPVKVKGGWDMEDNFTPQDTKWLVCVYGGSAWGDGDIEWWEQLDPKITHCVLKVRETKERPYPTRWTAAATCK